MSPSTLYTVAMDVRFFELAGDGAETQLRRLTETVRAEGARVRLLRSQEEPGLFLLVAEGGTQGPAQLPANCRTWRFTAVPEGPT